LTRLVYLSTFRLYLDLPCRGSIRLAFYLCVYAAALFAPH
jgi:hypothetical protein